MIHIGYNGAKSTRSLFTLDKACKQGLKLGSTWLPPHAGPYFGTSLTLTSFVLYLTLLTWVYVTQLKIMKPSQCPGKQIAQKRQVTQRKGNHWERSPQLVAWCISTKERGGKSDKFKGQERRRGGRGVSGGMGECGVEFGGVWVGGTWHVVDGHISEIGFVFRHFVSGQFKGAQDVKRSKRKRKEKPEMKKKRKKKKAVEAEGGVEFGRQ